MATRKQWNELKQKHIEIFSDDVDKAIEQMNIGNADKALEILFSSVYHAQMAFELDRRAENAK